MIFLLPHGICARMPMGLEVPSDFQDVGVSAMVRRLAYQRDLRLTAAGEPSHERRNWRNLPTTKYRQRAMAFSEASRMRGSMREELTRKITMAEGVDQACSSCDERLQICPLYIFGNKATDGTYGSKYWFPGFGFDSGPNLQPCMVIRGPGSVFLQIGMFLYLYPDPDLPFTFT